MQNQTSVLRSLLWKDAKTITPLLIMVGVGIVLFNIVALIGSMFSSSSPQSDTFLMVWVLMPNLVALGAPALLVGGEEESGTLGWLRTLPVRWQSIVNAKFLVAAASVLLTWIAASLGLALVLSLGVSRAHSDFAELMSLLGILKLLFFSALLLTLSFVCAYGFRSPILALLVLVPLITVVYLPVVNFGEFLFSQRAAKLLFGDSYAYSTPTSNILWGTVILLAGGLLIAFWILHRWLGHRRLTKPAGQKTLSTSIAESIEQPYRPPMMHNLQRPSAKRALLWQQYRQIGWVVIMLTALGVTGALATNLARNYALNNFLQTFVEFYSFFGIAIAGLGLGAIVFYGDSVNRRLAFFADRGISPGKIWWTRMLLPLAACLLVASVAAMVTHGWRTNPDQYLWLLIPGLFACGQVVSMWMSRPILSIFASPVYVILLAIPLKLFYDYYYGYGWTAVIAIPVLLLATWWLCKRWLAGDTGKPFHARMVLMTAFAILLPITSVLTYRIATTPAVNHAWRSKALAATMNTDLLGATPIDVLYGDDRSTRRWGGAHEYWYLEENYESLKQLQEIIGAEIDSIATARRRITNDDISMIFDPSNRGWDMSDEEQTTLRHETMKLVLTRINYAREYALSPGLSLRFLQGIAEAPEYSAVSLLSGEPDMFGDAETVRELVAMLPSDKLRRDSRIKTLLAEWRRYQPDFPRFIQSSTGVELPPTFGGAQLSQPGLFGIEKRRSDRFLDEAVRFQWKRLEAGLPGWDHEPYTNPWRLGSFVYSPQYSRYGNRGSGLNYWNRQHELDVAKLRELYAVP